MKSMGVVIGFAIGTVCLLASNLALADDNESKKNLDECIETVVNYYLTPGKKQRIEHKMMHIGRLMHEEAEPSLMPDHEVTKKEK